MEVQQIIVIATVCLCVLYAGIRILHWFNRIDQGGNPCEHCRSDCALKGMRPKDSKEKKEKCRK